MNNNDNMTVPYIVYESALDRSERRDKRHSIIIILLIVLLVVTNAMWLVAWNQYDYMDNYIEADQDGSVNIVGAGDIAYGAESDYSSENKNAQ